MVERIEELEQEIGKGDVYHDISEADAQFDAVSKIRVSAYMATEEYRAKARPLFIEEFKAAAVNGKVRKVDKLYVCIAKAPV